MDPRSSLETRYRAARHTSDTSVDEALAAADDPLLAPSARPSRHTKTKYLQSKLGSITRHKKWFLVAAAIIVVSLVAWRGISLLWSGIPGVKTNAYQAVFLTDGTQYVGKLANLDAGHYKLTNAYFITTNSTPVVSDSGSQQNATNQVALVKLETGLLNAENEMIIPKDKVLFYENLKSDGQAAKLIDNNK